MRRVYLYAGDLFRPLNLAWGELVGLAEDPAALLKRLPEVEELLGCRVVELKPFKVMVGESGDAVAEYLAVLEAGGEASVKLIYAEDPVKALREYYEWECTGRR